MDDEDENEDDEDENDDDKCEDKKIVKLTLCGMKTVENDDDSGPITLIQLESALADLIEELEWRPAQTSLIQQITYASVVPTANNQYQVVSKAVFTHGVVVLQSVSDDSISERTGFVDGKIFKELSQYIIRKDFFSLEATYGSPELSPINEGKVVGVFWSLDGEKEEYKMVFDWDGAGPYKLRRLHELLEDALSKAKWEEQVMNSMILYSVFALTLMFLFISGVLIVHSIHKSWAVSKLDGKLPVLTFKEEAV